MYELPHELPNDLRNLKKLGNFNKMTEITEMLGFGGEYPAIQPKAKF